MTLPSRVNLITLGVSDVSLSTQFYERLGWKKSTASNEQVTFFHSNGTVLGLFGREALAKDAQLDSVKDGFGGVTFAQTFESEAEVDTAFALALGCGAKPLKQPQKVFWGGYSGYFADPDGHAWELAYNPFMPLNAEGHMTLP